MARETAIHHDLKVSGGTCQNSLGSGVGRVATLSEFTQQIRQEADEDRQEREFRPDLEYERQPGIAEALFAVRSGVPVVFISGRAGTGKSKLIRYLETLPLGHRTAVVAPTGVAAMNLRASTIHALFRLPLGVLSPGRLEDDPWLDELLGGLKRLIIDEISMVRADILDAIDERLRRARGDPAPFGGVQLIMIGDFLQLPPVVGEEDRVLLHRLGYDTPFAFSALCLQNAPIRVATLKKVWRQSDPDMIEALARIREGRDVSASLEWLNSRCAGPHREGARPLLLTARRDAADRYNEDGIAQIRCQALEDGRPGILHRAHASGSFSLDESALPAPRDLELYVGARVMAVRNDPAGHYANGSLGTVAGFDRDHTGALMGISVQFDACPDISVRIEPAEWTKTRQRWSDEDDGIVEDETGVFEQFPLVPGYAITIHKSQGLSLDNLRIDLGRGAFAPGQLYVALSRATSVDGLSFARPLTPRDVQVDDMMVRFLQWARNASNLEYAGDLRVQEASREAV